MTTPTNQQINRALISLQQRAEAVDRDQLVATFVSAGPMFDIIRTASHQIIYGRRGTGKTHAMLYLAARQREEGHLPIYVDMRTTGSSGAIYDASLPVSERATRLLLDTLNAIHDELLHQALDNEDHINLGRVGPKLDKLADALSEVEVKGEVSQQETSSERHSDTTGSAASASLSTGQGPQLTFEGKRSSATERDVSTAVSRSGPVRHRVHFGRVHAAFAEVLDAVDVPRVWLILDEWSVIPPELQPYLADLIRRALLPQSKVTVKLSAIEQRSYFSIPGSRGDYIGIELGADMSADLNLDDFMVFENDKRRAVDFFKHLLYKHVSAALDPKGGG